MTSIQIHEFSTGIRPQINADGSWVSLGFTGQYMNVTINAIPHAVERSIANKEFAVAEGAFGDQPAVIGRVVLDSTTSDWSVVAVVSRGQDEKGRSASFYRYFLCEGRDNLLNIVLWMEEYERKNQCKPVFNPSETKVLGQATPFNAQNTSYPPKELLQNSTSTPIIINSDKRYSLQQINASAAALANGQPVAWAFNAEALEKPLSFIVIQAASERAYQILQRAAANTPKVQTPLVVDEQALKSAIKSLMGSSTVKPEVVGIIAEALSNKQVNQQYWENLFDGQGAINAIRQKIYSPQMVRLLTLRTLIIPQKLGEYLDWLEIKNNANKRDLNSNITCSLEFQANLIPTLPDSSIVQNNLNYLFKQIEVYNPPANVLDNIGDYCLDKLHNRELALLYYRFAIYFTARTNKNNVISDKLFKKAFSNSRGQENVFGRTVYSEQYRRDQGESDVPKHIVIVFVLLSFFLGGLGGFVLSEMTREPQTATNNAKTPPDAVGTDMSQPSNPNNNLNITASNNNQITPIPKGKKQKDAFDKFEKVTIPVINKIINDLDKQEKSLPDGVTRLNIIAALKETLGNSNLNESVLDSSIEPIPELKNDWINTIYSYQLQKQPNQPAKAEGYILPTGNVIKSLKQDVEKNLKKTSIPVAPLGN
ncbi:hypothetical protein DSM106972_092830 [Dulcicalothrix desertica PCC 7102]|uniref:Uncharacterized protein n=1 Tax=Dulcicalothrix desertica PCC 7102 TaxID=232991 RepID=A0A3S1C0X0_9CYAN|nr:hypothetical protein [Dulcicalothrix desertica]RUS94646.1 hypothetical protein DSM106972_092830 [Dulcicalothrix desertica PCC 7102]TWH62540.1 hypothetical protein CAL7102_00031 [Dulcicalothrix desertica PCC 7102]